METVRNYFALILFNFSYVVGFTAYYVSIRNFEFLWYVLVLVFFFVLIGATIHKSQFSHSVLWMLSIWGLLHMAGGGVPVGESVLYAYEIVHLFGSGDAFVLKFDQVVHFYGFFTATLVMHHLLRRHVANPYAGLVLFTVMLSGMGLGVLNEIVEFAAVVVAPDTGVGGYFNTVLDLVFNTLGAFFAVVFVYLRRDAVRG